MAQAKTHLSRLIDEALAGETVTITRHGKPTVEVRAAGPREPKRPSPELIEAIIARRKLRPSLGESGADIIRRMRDGERD